MNERIRPVGLEQAAPKEKPSPTDWSKEVELLKIRVRDIRRALSTGKSPEVQNASDNKMLPAASVGKSMLESLAYAQIVPIRQERPKRIARKYWRAKVFDTTIGEDPLPNSGWKNRQDRGDR